MAVNPSDKSPFELSNTINSLKENASYIRLAAFAGSFIVFGAVFYHIVEKLNWVDAFYFTSITLATVGYGDIVPKTDAGKLFTIGYVFVGITIYVVLARIVLAQIAVRTDRRRNKRKRD
jgi:voltage-gated potassium channel